MLVLDSALKSLEVKLAGAVTTTQLPFVSSYVDINQTTFALTGSTEQDGTTNSGTAITIITAPGASTTRKLNFLSVFNVDTVAAIVTIQVNNNGTLRIIWKGTLAVGDTLVYTDGENWKVFDSNGNFKTAIGGILPAANFPALTGDVTTTQGSLVTTIGASKVTNAMLAGSIAASKLVGTDITIVGTIVTGVWNAGAVTSSGPILTPGYLQFTASSAGAANGTMFRNVVNGLEILGVAGSSYDFSIWNPGGTVALLVNPTGTSNLTMAGLLTVSGFGTHNFSAGGATGQALVVTNTTSGTGAYTEITANAGTSQASLQAFSQGYSTSGSIIADGGRVSVTGPGGLSIIASHPSGAIRFYSGGATLRAQINANGTQTWAPYGSGTATFDASGNITSVSDERIKNNIIPFNLGLKEILSINPISYNYTKNSGLDTINIYTGFSAQQVMKFIPQAVGKGPNGFYTFNDRPVVAALVNAVKTLQDEIDSLNIKLLLTPFNRTIIQNIGETGIVKSIPTIN